MSFLLNSTFGIFSTPSGGGGGSVTGANNGLSLDGANVVLGNDEGTGVGGSAQLLNIREIDTNGFGIIFSDYTLSPETISTALSAGGIGLTDTSIDGHAEFFSYELSIFNPVAARHVVLNPLSIDIGDTAGPGARNVNITKDNLMFTSAGGMSYDTNTQLLKLLSGGNEVITLEGATLHTLFPALKTTVTPPVQTGTIKYVTTDDNGLLGNKSILSGNAMRSIYQRTMQNILAYYF